MRGRFSCFLVLILHIVSWVSGTSRPFAPNDGVASATHLLSPVPQASQVSMAYYSKFSSKVERMIGSRPPICENKCYGCTPCEATQVPTITSRIGIQYANYEPESWRCKCGPSIYQP